jgi:hypothetical protein
MSGARVPPPGLGGFGGFGGVGDSADNYDALAWSIKRLAEIKDNVEGDSLNTERYIKELSIIMIRITEATGRMFEQEPLRFMSMYVAAGNGAQGGRDHFKRGITEHRVIQNLKAVKGNKSLF